MLRSLHTGNVEPCFRASKSDASRDVGGNAAKRAVVFGAINPADVEIAVDLMTSTGVDQLASVQRPVEHDLTPIGHVATHQNLRAVVDVLVDRRRVEVETVLLFGLGYS